MFVAPNRTMPKKNSVYHLTTKLVISNACMCALCNSFTWRTIHFSTLCLFGLHFTSYIWALTGTNSPPPRRRICYILTCYIYTHFLTIYVFQNIYTTNNIYNSLIICTHICIWKTFATKKIVICITVWRVCVCVCL